MMAHTKTDETPGFQRMDDMETDEITITEKTDKAEKQGPKYLDLAFAMDCTGSMGSYISNARQNIRNIVELIVAEEKADVRLALVEYRDHPPQETSFVTRVHEFTDSVRKMKDWLDQCAASGGGDTPEAVADALLQVFKLDWRPDATKVCVFIADAPPHGLGCGGDGFPNGCPDGIDPMEVTGRLSQKGISLYIVGCEPSIISYRDFFMSLAHLTGGQYVPLGSAHLLAKVITGGIQEEISLRQLMQDVNQEVLQEFEAGGAGDISEDVLTTKVHEKLKAKGARAKKLQRNRSDLPEATPIAQAMSSCVTIEQVQQMQCKITPQEQMSLGGSMHGAGGGLIAGPATRAAPSFINRMFGFGAPAPPPMSSGLGKRDSGCDDDETPPPPGGYPEAASSSDMYECVEDDISEQQVQRMVQKSVFSNQLNTRYKKKF